MVNTTTISSFMKKHDLQNKATKGSKLLEVANKIGLRDFGLFIRTDKLTSKQGIINLTDNYKNGTHFVAFFDNNYFDSFCAEPPSIISDQLAEKTKDNLNDNCSASLYCECYISSTPIQNINDSNCGSYCLYFLDLMQNKKMSFQRAIVKLICEAN